MLSLTSGGMDSAALDSPLYGLYKRPPPHLVGSYRSLVPTSASIATESRLACRRISHTAELTGLWGHDTFAYRTGICPQYMALSLRASLAVHLAHSDTMWLLD